MLREGLTSLEKIRGDGAYLMAFRLLKVTPEALGIDSIDLAKYTNYHAPRVNPAAPENSTRAAGLEPLSEQSATALLAIEALLSQNTSIKILPNDVARRAGISESEAKQVIKTAYANLNVTR